MKSKEQLLLEEAYDTVRAKAAPQMGLLVDFISEGGPAGSIEEGICCLVPKNKFRPYVKFVEEFDPEMIEPLETKDGYIVYEEVRYCAWKKAFTTDYAKLLQSVLAIAGLMDDFGETALDAEEIQSMSIAKDQQSEFNSAIASGKWCKFKFKTSTIEEINPEEDEKIDSAVDRLHAAFGRERQFNTGQIEFDVFDIPSGIPAEGKIFTN